MTGVSHIVASLDTERHTAQNIAPQPAAQDTCTPLAARRLQLRLRVTLLATARTLHVHGCTLIVDAGHSLVFAQLFCLEELTKFLGALC